jgi:predicted peptidase
MADAKTKKKKGFLSRNFDFLLIFLLILPVYYLYLLYYPTSPFEPRDEPYAPYERHYHFDWRFPFVMSYFLMVPENYNPQNHTYPLVMILHGDGRRVNGAKVLTRPIMRENFPFFVMIPIMPFGYTWAYPQTWTLRPQSLPAAMSAMRSVTKQYGINKNQIYITGLSLGGIGTYAAISRYHDVFAAAAPADGFWDPAYLNEIDNIPIWIFHGAQDPIMPVENARLMANGLKQQGYDVRYSEFSKLGHSASLAAYENPDFWMWLIHQKKK